VFGSPVLEDAAVSTVRDELVRELRDLLDETRDTNEFEMVFV